MLKCFSLEFNQPYFVLCSYIIVTLPAIIFNDEATVNDCLRNI